MVKNRNGFTIVELLIVIVVIGILAAITIVAYNGVQQRAKVATAQSELSSLAKAAAIFNVDKGNYPVNTADWNAVFKSANLYDSTRADSVHSFILCYRATEYALVAWAPIANAINGTLIHFVSSNGGLGTFNWDSSVTGAYTTTRACLQAPVAPSPSVAWSSQI